MSDNYIVCAHCGQYIRVINKEKGKHMIVCPGCGYTTYVEIDKNGKVKTIKE